MKAMKAFCLVNLLVFCFFSSIDLHSEETVKKFNSIYMLSIGSASDDFDSNEILRASGKDIGGNVLIYINDNPVTVHSQGGTVLQLNQWIKNGQKTLQLKGTTSIPLYLKIAKTKNGTIQSIVFKKIIKTITKKQTGKFVFKTDIPYTLPIFNKKNILPKNNKSVKNFVLNYLDLMKKKEYGEFVDIQLSGRGLWQTLAYGIPFDIEKQKQAMIDNYKKNPIKIQALDWNSLQVLRGLSTILIYDKIDKYGQPYLCKGKMNDIEINIPALKIAYVSQKWVLWE